MKTTSINVQITKCPKQYEAVRMGMEIQLEPGDVEAEVIKAAHAELCKTYDALMDPAKVMDGAEVAKANQANANAKHAAAPADPAPVPEKKEPAKEPAKEPVKEPVKEPAKREPLVFGDPRVQQIVRRMEKYPSKAADVMDNALKYFEPDAQVMNVLKLAAKIV